MTANQHRREIVASLDEEGGPLSAFQRILVLTDGTVTDLLEAFVKESIWVEVLAQSLERGGSEGQELELIETERVLRRTVVLRGVSSGEAFLYGDSVVLPDRLPAAVLKSLLTTTQPIGKLLAENRVETFREIEGVRFERMSECARHFDVDASAPFVFRTYRIHVGQRPVMRITEGFPLESFGAHVGAVGAPLVGT
jgi:chorismate-pyruvate lyase